MTGLVAWGGATLAASTVLMLVVLALRGPVRRWAGARLGYALWALPALRLALPPLPAGLLADWPVASTAATGMAVLFAGPAGPARAAADLELSWIPAALVAVWAAGAFALLATYAVRHIAFCARLRATGTRVGSIDGVEVVAADVAGPLAFGVVRRVIAVPRGFADDYDASQRDLALAHERAHHARGDLLANWASLVVLAVHWWNPVAWVALAAFRDDQEFAADAHVLAATPPAARPLYADVLAKAAGIGALPACNLTARSNLKGRLMMIRETMPSRRRQMLGGAALALLGSAALAATLAAPGTARPAAARQAVTIGVKPDGAGGYALVVGGTAVDAGAPLPGGLTLPADFTAAESCDLKPTARPTAMVIKGSGATRTYTVMCARPAAAPLRATLTEGLASLTTMRASVATQPASKVFPEAERAHALGAIDRSIREVKATLATLG